MQGNRRIFFEEWEGTAELEKHWLKACRFDDTEKQASSV